VTDYYDGPRRGIADFNGTPHLYESRWSDIDTDDDDTFLLCPVDLATLALALEDWAIWRRYEVAFHEGRAPAEWHPALPADRQRHSELEPLLRALLIVDESIAFCAKGEFKPRPQDTYEPGMRPLVVRWISIPCNQYRDNRKDIGVH
jgi:hypothetical protein